MQDERSAGGEEDGARGRALFDVGQEQRDALLRFLRSQCGDAHALEDLVQETLLRGVRNADRLREAASLSHWLMRIAWNVALDWRRRRVRRNERCVDPDEPELETSCRDDDPVERTERAGLRRRWCLDLRRALRGLKPRDRVLVIGHYFVGFSCAELAARAGLTRANVKVRLCRSRKTLRELLPDGFEPEAVQSEEAAAPRRCWPLARIAGERGDDEWAEAV